MPRVCFICKKKDYKDENVYFSTLPQNPEKRKIWLSRLNFSDETKFPKRTDICSDHFDPADFEMVIYGSRRLKREAIPKMAHSLFDVPENISTTSTSTDEGREFHLEQRSAEKTTMDASTSLHTCFESPTKSWWDQKMNNTSEIESFKNQQQVGLIRIENVKEENPVDAIEEDEIEIMDVMKTEDEELGVDFNISHEGEELVKYIVKSEENEDAADSKKPEVKIKTEDEELGVDFNISHEGEELLKDIIKSEENEDAADSKKPEVKIEVEEVEGEKTAVALNNIEVKSTVKLESAAPYHYSICEKSFKSAKNLGQHKRIHAERKISCQYCDKKFVMRTELIQHVRTHTGEKPFKCNVCHKCFGFKGNLTNHLKIHTGVKPFKCNVCHKAFSQKIALSCHLLIHTGEKPYKCNVCNKYFSRNERLKRHRQIHTIKRPEREESHTTFIQNTSCRNIDNDVEEGISGSVSYDSENYSKSEQNFNNQRPVTESDNEVEEVDYKKCKARYPGELKSFNEQPKVCLLRIKTIKEEKDTPLHEIKEDEIEIIDVIKKEDCEELEDHSYIAEDEDTIEGIKKSDEGKDDAVDDVKKLKDKIV